MLKRCIVTEHAYFIFSPSSSPLLAKCKSTRPSSRLPLMATFRRPRQCSFCSSQDAAVVALRLGAILISERIFCQGNRMHQPRRRQARWSQPTSKAIQSLTFICPSLIVPGSPPIPAHHGGDLAADRRRLLGLPCRPPITASAPKILFFPKHDEPETPGKRNSTVSRVAARHFCRNLNMHTFHLVAVLCFQVWP